MVFTRERDGVRLATLSGPKQGHIFFLEALDLPWISPESCATVVQINGFETDDLVLL